MDFELFMCQAEFMDILADILKTAGLKKRILRQNTSDGPWAMQFPCSHSMGFHVLTQGEAWLWSGSEAIPQPLKRGTIAFMARGTPHFISSHPDRALLETAAPAEICQHFEKPKISSKRSGQVPPLVSMVSGAYQLWNEPIHPLFRELPEWVIIQAEQLNYADALQHALQLLALEQGAPSLGSEAIVSGLLDILFHLILRRILDSEVTRNHTWSKAVKDPALNQALQLMHGKPSHDWSLEELAAAAGLSRSGFALRFKQVLGDTPHHYLTTLRILQAMERLNESDENLENVARAVGYQDAFAFSKAFKKALGLSPKAFRQKNRAERQLVWKFS